MIRLLFSFLFLLFFNLQVASQSLEQNPPSSNNTYVPSAGSPLYNFFYRVGAACQGNGIYTTPGIGPAPSAGILWICADLADSTSGNFSAIFAVAYNSGGRYTAPLTGIGVLKPGTVGGNAWGVQCSAIAQGNASGILQGCNIEADWASGSVVGIAATVKLGSSDGSTNYNPGNSYFNFLADTGRAPLSALRFQANAIDPSGSVIDIEGSFSGCFYRVNGSCMAAGGAQKSMLVANTNSAVAAGQTIYFSTGGYSGGNVQAEIPTSFAFTARNFYAKGHGPAGNGQSFTYALLKNGAATGVTCTVSGTSQSQCNDTVNTVSFVAGDHYQVRLITSGAAATVVHAASFEINP